MTVIAACLVGFATWLIMRPPLSRARNRASTSGPPRAGGGRVRPVPIACVALGIVVAVAVGGAAGIVAGAAIAVIGPRLLARMETRGQRQRRELLERQAPMAADLLAACLASGATARDSARAVARAVGDPIRGPLDRLTGALDLGADPANAWRALAVEPCLQPIARAGARSAQSGAPLAALLAAAADEQRDVARSRAEAAARASGVRSVAPLVACFLPAFILIGIVPVVASLALPLLQ